MHQHISRIAQALRGNSRGVTLIELIVTLAIFGAVTTVLVGSFLTLFSVREQVDVAQRANDDIRVVLDNLEREVQAGNDIEATGNTLKFTVSSREGQAPYQVQYKLLNNTILKAIQKPNAPNSDPCKTVTAGNLNDTCFLPITGSNVNVQVLSFSAIKPNENDGQSSPLVTIGLSGSVTDSANKATPLTYSTSITPRNRVTVSDVTPTIPVGGPATTLSSLATVGSCDISTGPNWPVNTPAPPTLNRTYYTDCASVQMNLSISAPNGFLLVRYNNDQGGGNLKTGVGENPGTASFAVAINGALNTTNTLSVHSEDLFGLVDDDTIRLVKVPTFTPPPTVTLSHTCPGGTCDAGESITLTWTTTDANSCTASGDWAGAKNPGGGSENTGALAGGSYTYRLSCTGLGGGPVVDTDAVTMVIPTPPPAFNLNANPVNIALGDQTRITWSAVSNGSSCTASASSINAGAWNGSKVLTGGFTDVRPTAVGNYTYRLDCTGPGGNGSRTANVTVGPSAVNGSCGASNNVCNAGSLNDIADNATTYLWNCNGQNGGSNASCSVPKPATPVNGSCGASNNVCNAGTFVDTADNATTYLWNCNGQNGGSTASCSVPKPPAAVNGSCGASNNVCNAGSLNDIADNATTYLWNCNGQNGGSNASCSVPKPATPVNGSCGASNNVCNAGTFVDTADNATTYLWNCNGQNGGSTASCSEPKPPPAINGSCGGSNNVCNAGSLNDIADNATTYLWNCNGQNGGSTAGCSEPKPPPAINGSCGGSNNVCTAGSLNDIADNATTYLWNCNGQNGGSNASCSVPKPPPAINGVCGGSNNVCNAGSLNDIADNATTYLWNCNGQNGGSTAGCSAAKPPAQPAIPTGLTATPGTCGTGRIDVSWNAVSGATSYNLRDGAGIIYTGGGTSYPHILLSANSVHTYSVEAVGPGGNSTYSGGVTRNAPSACAAGVWVKTSQMINTHQTCGARGVSTDSSWVGSPCAIGDRRSYGVQQALGCSVFDYDCTNGGDVIACTWVSGLCDDNNNDLTEPVDIGDHFNTPPWSNPCPGARPQQHYMNYDGYWASSGVCP